MTSPARRSRALLFAPLLAALALTGCAAHSSIMARMPAAEIEPEPENAVVVFIRPSGMYGSVLVPIIDGQGHLLGELEAGARFAVAVPPGEHLFAGWIENTSAVHANLAAGRIYAIEIGPRPGFFAPRVQLFAIKPSLSSWPKLGDWMHGTSLFGRLPAAPPSIDAAKIADHLEAAREALDGYDRDEMAKHSIEPDDAFAAIR